MTNSDTTPVMKKPKTLIAVLASHDSRDRNEALANIFNTAAEDVKLGKTLRNFRFLFSGGTYLRLFEGKPVAGSTAKATWILSKKAKKLLLECGVIRLPSAARGGVTILASLVSSRKLSILWPFFTPRTTHLLFPENLALLRLADQWRAKKLMNTGSVMEWLRAEADRDQHLNRQDMEIKLRLIGSEAVEKAHPVEGMKGLFDFAPQSQVFPDFHRASTKNNIDSELEKSIVALISHDEMKPRMLDFVTDYEHELRKFHRILATGTTGRLIEEAAPSIAEKVFRYHSGPKGGDVEIATEILFGGCHVVIFFVDPLHPHPHPEDIRVVFGACMIHDQVRMLSNEVQARDWMDRLVRGR